VPTFAHRAKICNARNCEDGLVRIKAPGLRLRDAAVTIRFEGRPVECRDGDSLAAALVAAGELACRVTSAGDARGVFCGMGVCHDCVVVVDGAPARACMTRVRDGMTVAIQPAAPSLPEDAPVRLQPAALAPDLLVVGGGPGGLSAAAAAAEAGAEVVLADERSKLGGQYFKQPSDAFDVNERSLDRQYRSGRELIRRVERAGVDVEKSVQIWGATSPHELLAVGEGRALALRPRRLVLATGAYERGVPVPGWTLPGFMATGAAQTLMRAYQVAPGQRVLVSGNGPLNAQVAAELVRAGATVVALCETAHAPGPARAGAVARMCLTAPDLVRDGVRYLRVLRRAHVPLLFGHSIVRAEGADRVERAVVARVDGEGRAVPGSERAFDVDAVCVGFGFLPSNELARTLGVAHVFDSSLGQLAAVRDVAGRTNVEDVWVVGDGGSTGGARLAQAVGTLAGIDVARTLGLDVPREPGRNAERVRRRNQRFQRALGALYAAPRLTDQLAEPETLICRCEGVSLAAAEAAFAHGTESIGAVKRVTRAGMGRCQGRYCAPVLAEIAACRSSARLDENAWFAPAPPFKPLPLSLVAAATEALVTAPARTARDRASGLRRGRASPRASP
jgi:NADPH-dependent 2,4-dienoyl-CoA reductase/sulfur reductase-like enzyme